MEEAYIRFVQSGLLDESQLRNLSRFVDLFVDYNKKVNLSAIRDNDAVWRKHIIDSLVLLEHEQLNGNVIDVGTGGGLPGIPLAISCPGLHMTLLDSTGKKVRACESFVDGLQLQNAHTIQARVEQLGQDEAHAAQYDVVISRATAYLPVILAWSKRLIKPDGKIILYKTPSATELADGVVAAKHLKLKLQSDHAYTLDTTERHLLVYAARPVKRS